MMKQLKAIVTDFQQCNLLEDTFPHWGHIKALLCPASGLTCIFAYFPSVFATVLGLSVSTLSGDSVICPDDGVSNGSVCLSDRRWRAMQRSLKRRRFTSKSLQTLRKKKGFAQAHHLLPRTKRILARGKMFWWWRVLALRNLRVVHWKTLKRVYLHVPLRATVRSLISRSKSFRHTGNGGSPFQGDYLATDPPNNIRGVSRRPGLEQDVFTNQHVEDMLQLCEDVLMSGVTLTYFAGAFSSLFEQKFFSIGEAPTLLSQTICPRDRLRLECSSPSRRPVCTHAIRPTSSSLQDKLAWCR